MTRWAEVLLTLILFAVVMSAVSWAVGATVPTLTDWVWDRIGGLAAWAILLAVLAAAGAYGIYDHRRAGERAKGR